MGISFRIFRHGYYLGQPFSICGTRTTGGTRAPSSGTRSMNDFLKQFFEVEATVKKKIWDGRGESITRVLLVTNELGWWTGKLEFAYTQTNKVF